MMLSYVWMFYKFNEREERKCMKISPEAPNLEGQNLGVE